MFVPVPKQQSRNVLLKGVWLHIMHIAHGKLLQIVTKCTLSSGTFQICRSFASFNFVSEGMIIQYMPKMLIWFSITLDCYQIHFVKWDFPEALASFNFVSDGMTIQNVPKFMFWICYACNLTRFVFGFFADRKYLCFPLELMNQGSGK